MQTLNPILAVGDVMIIVPILAITLSMAIPIVAIMTEFFKRRTLYELHHKERLAAIEKGIELPPLPPELFGAGPKGRPRYLLRGLVWLFLGLGLLIALSGVSRPEAANIWMLGFVPTGIGLAYLIYYFVEGKRVEAEAARLEAETARKPQ